MKKVFKFATGQEIPEGAKFLSTIVEEGTRVEAGDILLQKYRFVWHYFLVEVKNE